MENTLKFNEEGNLIIPQSVDGDIQFNKFAKDFKGNKQHLKIFMRVNNLEMPK